MEDWTVAERKDLVNKNSKKMSVHRQSKLLEINRSSLYYAPIGESDLNLRLMALMDKNYLNNPTYGVLRMQDELKEHRHNANH